MTRIIDIADGFTSATTPTTEGSIAASIESFANDAAYEAKYTKVEGSTYWDSTLKKVKYYDLTNTVWRQSEVALDNATGSNPLSTSDSDSGYQVLSLWLNTSSGALFRCTDASVSAAVWQEIASDAILDAHIADTSTHGTTGAILGTTDTQTLTNKTFDDEITIKEIAEPSTPASGYQKVYVDSASGNLKKKDDTGAVSDIGSGGGGLDVFATNDYELANSFTTGNQAAPDAAGTGTLNGTVSDETSAPVSGSQSLKYVMGATSTNDFFLNDADLALDEKQTNNWIGANFYYTYNGTDDDIRFFVLDQDDAELITSIEYIKSNSTATRFSTAVYIPDGTTGIRYGFQVVTGNSAKIFITDDLELSTNPFVYKDLVKSQTYSITQAGSSLTDRTAEIEYALGSATITNIGDPLIVATDDSGNTRTKFISSYDGLSVNISYTQVVVTGNQTAEIYKNGTSVVLGSQVVANNRSSVSWKLNLDAGEYFTVGSSGNCYNGADPSYLSFTASVATEHVVTPSTGTLTNWASYTPTTQGIGTPTINVAKWRQVGENYEIIIEGTAGTTTAAELQIGLPNSKTVSGVGTNVLVGQGGRDIASTTISDFSVLATDGDSFVNLSVFNNSGAGSLTPQNGSTLLSGTDGFSLQFSVKVNGLTANATFLAAIPLLEQPQIDVAEHDTGKKWSDGKTIYRQQIDGSYANNATLVTGVDKMIDSGGVFELSASRHIAFPFNDGTTSSALELDPTTGIVKHTSGATYTLDIWIEYTKD